MFLSHVLRKGMSVKKNRLLSSPFLVAGLLFVMTFSLSIAAYAATWPGTWPVCGDQCRQYGPDGSQSPDQCNNCCFGSSGCGNSSGNDGSGCLACCNSYNYGNPNGNTHCQGEGPIPPMPAPVDPYG